MLAPPPLVSDFSASDPFSLTTLILLVAQMTHRLSELRFETPARMAACFFAAGSAREIISYDVGIVTETSSENWLSTSPLDTAVTT